ncbi:RNase H domain-containing protein [Trichonephila clavipes]|uniref:RNase H domain-containing protein n=1 Tax=Trichonephila clavipes TaxID=2585209 RepID=A0A8X6SWE3_TRICX|nr:RNase H domain-containing protein [Trichonephila clavipes]
MNPLKDLPRVFFHEELFSFSSKKNQHPAHLRQLALETIHNTSPDAVNIFTDGSKFDSGSTGSGVVIKNLDAITKIKRRRKIRAVHFRSLSSRAEKSVLFSWRVKSSIQYLSNWRIIGDRIGLNIIDNVKTYSTHNDIHLQWIPSHVELYFNDLANELAKEGSNDPIGSSDLLTCNEIYSKVKTDNNSTWKTPPSHDWYQQNGPGAALELKGDRNYKTNQ